MKPEIKKSITKPPRACAPGACEGYAKALESGCWLSWDVLPADERALTGLWLEF